MGQDVKLASESRSARCTDCEDGVVWETRHRKTCRGGACPCSEVGPRDCETCSGEGLLYGCDTCEEWYSEPDVENHGCKG